ncbi:MAG: hypothetical protein WCP21_08675 [Armatimonadota bacterium]
MRDITLVWERIKEHQGEQFETMTGKVFTYEVEDNRFWTDRPVKYPVGVGEFEKALKRVPVDRPSDLNNLRAYCYIWAILHDPRIRRDDW